MQYKSKNYLTPYADFPALYAFTISNQITPLSRPCIPTPPFCSYLLASYLHIPFYWDLLPFITFHIKRIESISPIFWQCCPFRAGNIRNFRSLYFSFLTVTLACHYWAFSAIPMDLKLQGPSTGETKGTSCTHFSLSMSLSLPLSSSILFFLFQS